MDYKGLSSLSEFPPGTDLCQIPGASAPLGVQFRLNGPNPLKPATIAISVVFTILGVIFGLGRVYANIRKPSPGDILVLLAVLVNTATAILTSVYVKLFQHQWNIPLCWLIDPSLQPVLNSFEILTAIGLLFSKIATLLLLRQLFGVSRAMRIAIWVGVAFTIVLYTESIIFAAYFVHLGSRPYESLYNGVAQGAAGTALDLYIFILPLRTIYELNLSKKQKTQMMGVFLTAALGVAASIVSLVFRVKAATSDGNDFTYNTGLLLNFNLIEMDSALIVSSTAGFAYFVRVYVIPRLSQLGLTFSRLEDSAGGQFHKLDHMQNPNRPRTGREQHPSPGRESKKTRHPAQRNDTWFLHSDTTRADIETGQRTQSDITVVNDE
ncbi:hypothetical protein F4680DRAFT_465973 [Xylaria scruposa]|nr:hypothetical protein F4680DRAFT_465973 [Xylaria scruposa]